MQSISTSPADRQELVRLRAALAATGDVAYEWDLLADTFTWYNGAADALGLKDSDLPRSGKDMDSLISHEDLAVRANSLAQLQAGDLRFQSEYR